MASSRDHSTLPAAARPTAQIGANVLAAPCSCGMRASQICGMAAQSATAENRPMSALAPLDVYRQFQSFLLDGEYGRLTEVADMDGYRELCVGVAGWTTGLQAALRSFQENVASRLTDLHQHQHSGRMHRAQAGSVRVASICSSACQVVPPSREISARQVKESAVMSVKRHRSWGSSSSLRRTMSPS